MSKNSYAKAEARNVQQSLDTAFAEDDFHILMQLMSRFPHYSYRNILILKARCPGAQMLKKYRTWFKHGRAVREREKAIPICSFLGEDSDDREDTEKEPSKNKSFRNKMQSSERKGDYRYIPLFDISQTEELEDFEGEAVGFRPVDLTPRHRQNVVAFNQDVPGFGELMSVLQTVCYLPISFSAEIEQNGMLTKTEIIIKTGITQLQAVRAILTQMIHDMIHFCFNDKAIKEAEAESIVYIVSKRLGLETAGLRLQNIESFGAGLDVNKKKAFLDQIQKTAMLLVDTIEGEQEARRIGYHMPELRVFIAKKTAYRLLRTGNRVWMINSADLDGKWALNAKEIENHAGPFASPCNEWYDVLKRAA